MMEVCSTSNTLQKQSMEIGVFSFALAFLFIINLKFTRKKKFIVHFILYKINYLSLELSSKIVFVLCSFILVAQLLQLQYNLYFHSFFFCTHRSPNAKRFWGKNKSKVSKKIYIRIGSENEALLEHFSKQISKTIDIVI